MKYLPIFNKGDKVKVNDKYPDLKSMKGEVYTIQAGPVKTCGTWCYFLERVAGGIAADALEPEKQTNEEWLDMKSTKEKAEWLFKLTYKCYWCGREYTPRSLSLYNEKECPFKKCMKDKKDFEKWLKEKHNG